MNRYINACNLLTKIKAYRPYQYLGEDALSYAIKMVELEPSADVRENVRGEWAEIEVIAEVYDISGVKTWASKMKCDQCGFTTIAIEGHFSQYNFCPNCGADMRGGKQ